jgi:hypothetical protein
MRYSAALNPLCANDKLVGAPDSFQAPIPGIARRLRVNRCRPLHSGPETVLRFFARRHVREHRLFLHVVRRLEQKQYSDR